MTEEQLEALNDENEIKKVLTKEKLSYEDAVKLLKKVKDVNFIKKYFEHTHVLIADIISIVISTGDIDYIKEYITYVELMFGNVQYLADLVIATEDIDYIKEHLEKKRDKYSMTILVKLLLATNDNEYIEKFLKEADDRMLEAMVLSSTKDPEYIKRFLQSNFATLTEDLKLELLKKTNDKEYIYECMTDKSFGLRTTSRVILIKSVNDDSFTKKCLYDVSLGLDDFISELIFTIKDEDIAYAILSEDVIRLDDYQKESFILRLGGSFAKKCAFNQELNISEFLRVDLIGYLEDKVIEEYLETNSLNFSRKSILILLKGLKDIDYIMQEVLSDRLTRKERIELLSVQNDEFIYKIITSDDINLPAEDVIQLIHAITDKEVQEKIFNNSKLELSDDVKLQLALRINNEKLIEQYSDIVPWGIVFADKVSSEIGLYDKKIKLPPEMTFGLEIESEGLAWELIMDKFCYSGWKTVRDRSLFGGVEIKSPVLHASHQAENDMFLVTSMLNAMGQKATERCGGHIHIGADFLKSKQAWSNLIEIWCNTEKILYAICNEAGEAPRAKVVTYAKPVAPKVQEAIETGSITLDNDDELNEFILNIKALQIADSDYPFEEEYNRYCGINFVNVFDVSKNTVEFRIPNGTIDPDLWIENINLFGGIVAISQELAELQELPSLTAEQQRKIEIFDKLKTNISDKEKLEILIELIGLEPEGYRRRFDANIKLVEAEQELIESFSTDTPIIVKPKSKANFSVDEIGDAVQGGSALEQVDAMNKITSEVQQRNVGKQK